MAFAKTPFSQREWFGLIAGICWGLILSHWFAADDMTGPWLVILFGPPVVLLISPARPILSWQLPIVTAVLAGTFLNRTADDAPGGALAEATITWLICSVLSAPWAIIFHHRAQRFRELHKTPGIPVAYVGMVLLVFLCCAVTFAGFVVALYFTDANEGSPFYGVLLATGGIALSMVTERIAKKLEIQKLVRGVFEVLMIPGVLILGCFGIGGIVSLFWLNEHLAVDEHVVCGFVVGVEALAMMLWLTRLDRQEKASAVQAQ